MNHFKIALLSTLLPLFGISQTFVSVNMNSVPSAPVNVLFAGSTMLGSNSEIGGGIRIHTREFGKNHLYDYDFYKALYPANFLEHFGLNAFYNHHIFTQLEHLDPFVFADIQYAFADSRPVLGYHQGPFHWLDLQAGIGFRVFISSHFFLHQKMGYGFLFVFNEPLNIDRLESYQNYDYGIGPMFQFGFGYAFHNN